MATTLVGVALFFVTLASVSTAGAVAAPSGAATTVVDQVEDDGPPTCGPSRDGQLWTDPWNGSVWQCRYTGCYWGWFLVIPSLMSDLPTDDHSLRTAAGRVVAC